MHSLTVLVLLGSSPVLGSRQCSSDVDCVKGDICVSSWIPFQKECKAVECSSVDDKLLERLGFSIDFLELHQRSLGNNDISSNNPYGKPYDTTKPSLNDVLDWSNCTGLGGTSLRCEVRCREPKYGNAGTKWPLQCERDGSVRGFLLLKSMNDPCRPKYSRTTPIKTQQGSIRGIRRPFGCEVDGNCVDTYFDVPYARPPIGGLRFRPPQPLDSAPNIEIVRDLPVEPSKGCLGWSGSNGALVGLGARGPGARDPEDCLYLHIYVPSDTFPSGKERLPVMVNLFGGGFAFGDSWEGGTYDGAGIAKMSRAIVVSPNFRVGLLGHMALQGLKDSDPQRTTGNYGLQDQRATLEWIQKNIHAFGGDPKRVQLYGLSSGAFSVHYHRLSPRSRPLFASGFSVSAAQATEWWYQPLVEADAFYSVLSHEAGCPTRNTSPDQIRSCLTKLTVESLFNATRRHANSIHFDKQSFVTDILHHWMEPSSADSGVRPFNAAELAEMGDRIPMRANPAFPVLPCGPCIDGSDEGLPASPRELLRRGDFSTAPNINIVTKNEGSMFAPLIAMSYPFGKISWPMTHEGVDTLVRWMFPNSVTKILDELYSRSRLPNPDSRFDSMITEAIFSCSNRLTAMQSTRFGSEQEYLIDWHASFSGIWRNVMGSGHAEPAAHMLYEGHGGGFWPKEGDFVSSPEQAQLGVWLSCAHARLASCGDPRGCDVEIPVCLDMKGVKDIAEMQPYSLEKDERLVVDSGAGMIPGISAATSWADYKSFSNDYKARCDFWEKEPFKFVPSFYNQKPDFPAPCLGSDSAVLPGSTHWLNCGKHQHKCMSGILDGCCCNAGFRVVPASGTCVACNVTVFDQALLKQPAIVV